MNLLDIISDIGIKGIMFWGGKCDTVVWTVSNKMR